MTADVLEWAVDVLAEELTATPAPIRRQVLEKLVQRAGYESADTEFDPEARVLNMRAELVRRLVARVDAMEERRGVVIPLMPRDARSSPLLPAACDARR